MRDGTGGVQSVLVLGGTSDIAVATVQRLVADRCRTVVLAGRASEGLDHAATTLRSAGAAVELAEFDATDVAGHADLIAAIFARHDIDLVLLAFGVLGDQTTFDHDHRAAIDAVTVNYTGAVSASLAVADCLRQQGHGTLVVLSSVAGVRVRKDNFVYGSTKAGLDGFAQGLGDALHGSGARVMVVRPGFVRTKMTAGMAPAPFAATTDEVAADIVAGLRKRREIVWSPSILRAVFGVLQVVPRPIWRRLSAR